MANAPRGIGKRSSRQYGITALSVSGYKALRDDYEIEIRPLTILAGANSSGKSSIVQPILLLKQTLEASYDPGALLIDGPNVRFTTASQLLAKLPRGKVDQFKIGLRIDDKESALLTFIRSQNKGIQIAAMMIDDGEQKAAFTPEMSFEEIAAALPESAHEFQKLIASGDKKTNWTWSIQRKRCFLEVNLEQQSNKGERAISISLPFLNTSNFQTRIRGLIHVPGLRGNPERTYKTTAIGHEFPGRFENYVASVIAHWKSTEDDRLGELGKNLETLGLTWKVDARQIDDTQVELLVGRLPHAAKAGAKDMVNVADVGFGTSQILPVLVALLTAQPGQFVHLEQPEIHLHPRAQSAMAQVLIDAANRGVRVIAETHSSLLLLAIQSLVAEGAIAPDKVKLHWFKRGQDGVTQISSADLDDAGTFGDWPEDFADVALEAEDRFLTATEQKRADQYYAIKTS